VLQSHAHSEPVDDVVDRVHELAVHGALPAGLEWMPMDALASRAPADRDAIASWRAAPAIIVDGREWTRPEWFAQACDWIRASLGDTEVRAIVQVRAWMSSCVLRVTTARSEFYFKAVPESLRVEVAATAYLDRHRPGAVAPVVASEPDRRWLLMAGIPGTILEHVADLAAWERAAAEYGALQASCIARVDDLRALGCPTRPLEAIAAGLDSLNDDLPSSLRDRCVALAKLDVPLTLEHGDLWPGNFIVDGTTCALIDWEDVAIGHPFVSLAPFLAGLAEFQPARFSPAAVERIQRAYLTGFAGGPPSPRLFEALRLAAPLAFVDMALRYRALRASAVRLHPWMRDLVPYAIRLARLALAVS